jgi:hypothetical protein
MDKLTFVGETTVQPVTAYRFVTVAKVNEDEKVQVMSSDQFFADPITAVQAGNRWRQERLAAQEKEAAETAAREAQRQANEALQIAAREAAEELIETPVGYFRRADLEALAIDLVDGEYSF